ncbi:hypothetical protein M5689_000532 [Euphorbia peplus]|nr:hypothetical protein M5689_000532 [Euphorbia peplus]
MKGLVGMISLLLLWIVLATIIASPSSALARPLLFNEVLAAKKCQPKPQPGPGPVPKIKTSSVPCAPIKNPPCAKC